MRIGLVVVVQHSSDGSVRMNNLRFRGRKKTSVRDCSQTEGLLLLVSFYSAAVIIRGELFALFVGNRLHSNSQVTPTPPLRVV